MLSEEKSVVTKWATGECNTWHVLQNGIRSLVTPFAVLAKKAEDFSAMETVDVLDCLQLFLDLTSGYKILIERHEKGVLRDHQIALHKLQQYKQRQMNATIRNNDSVDTLEHRIVAQEGAIHTMENRNYFSLYCLQMETQFIHANLVTLVEMLNNIVDIQVKKHKELCALWEDMREPVQNLATNTGTTTNFLTTNTQLSQPATQQQQHQPTSPTSQPATAPDFFS